MKRLAIWCAAFFLLFRLNQGYAQTALVLRGGGNFNKPAEATNSNAGLHGSIGLSLPLVKKWKVFVQPEFAYVQKGYTTYNFAYFGHRPEPARLFKVRMNYTEFPILIRKEFRLTRRTGMYLLAGPGFGSQLRKLSLTYTVDGQRQQQNEFGTTVDWLEKEMTRTATPTDLTLNAGAGFSAGVGHNRLGIEFRYSGGTKSIGSSHPGSQRTFSLSAVYFFNLGKP